MNLVHITQNSVTKESTGITPQLIGAFFANFTSKETADGYFRDVTLFFEFSHSRFPMISHVREYNQSHIIIYRDHLEKGGYAPKSVRRKITALSQFFKYLKSIGLILLDPTDRVKVKKAIVRTHTEALEDEEAKRVIDHLDGRKVLCPKRLAIYILLATGIRRAEVLNIRIGDFYKYNDRHYLRVVGKNDKEVTKFIPDWVASEIQDYINHLNSFKNNPSSNDLMISWVTSQKKEIKPVAIKTLHQYIKNLMATLEINKRISAHSFRATYITSAFESGMDIYKIQADAGHSSINTTIHYNKRVKRKEESPAHFISFLKK